MRWNDIGNINEDKKFSIASQRTVDKKYLIYIIKEKGYKNV